MTEIQERTVIETQDQESNCDRDTEEELLHRYKRGTVTETQERNSDRGTRDEQ